MKPRKKDESDAAYIRRLEDANDGLRQENGGIRRGQLALVVP